MNKNLKYFTYMLAAAGIIALTYLMYFVGYIIAGTVG